MFPAIGIEALDTNHLTHLFGVKITVSSTSPAQAIFREQAGTLMYLFCSAAS
jgi:hypothetical protein